MLNPEIWRRIREWQNLSASDRDLVALKTEGFVVPDGSQHSKNVAAQLLRALGYSEDVKRILQRRHGK